MVRLLVCGGGNGAHVLAGLASSNQDIEVRVLTLFGDESKRWTSKMAETGFKVRVYEHGSVKEEIKGLPKFVTNDTALAAADVDVIVITVPAFAHAGYLKALKPYMKSSMILAALPGQSGFEFEVKGLWGDVAKDVNIISFETLPWACRIVEFGHMAEVLGCKEKIMGSINPGKSKEGADLTATLQKSMGEKPELVTYGHIIGMSLMGVNGYIHPCIMYGQWNDWDGKPLKEKPLFYHGVSQEGAQILSDVSDEIMAIAKAITKQFPQVDLSNVQHVHDWYKKCYPKEIKDNSTLYSCLRTNNAYNGLTHPTVQDANGMFSVDYKYRYLTEDIPYGLAVIKGIAVVVGLNTPATDKILLWAQKCMGKEYLIDGKFCGKDIKETRSPQAYGISSIKDMLDLN